MRLKKVFVSSALGGAQKVKRWVSRCISTRFLKGYREVFTFVINVRLLPLPSQVLLLERWMTVALAAHAANAAGETKEEGSDPKRAGHAGDDSYDHSGRRSPLSTSAAASHAGDRGHGAFHGTSLGRPVDPVQSKNGGVGDSSSVAREHFIDATATLCPTATPCPTAAAPADEVNAPGRGAPEADGHQGDGTTASSAEEEKKAAKIRAQMSVLMVGFFEIIRQVCARCFALDGLPD